VLQALATPYVQERGMVAEVAAPGGVYRVVEGPLRAAQPLRAAPSLGEHTAEVLSEVLGPQSPLLALLLAREGQEPAR
ncbi:MAG TPA: hypothetical protein VE173_07430, partial [Longimicrobiales bacterium]|nr:hypothetical protein [Longimicrobiales bacterium]